MQGRETQFVREADGKGPVEQKFGGSRMSRKEKERFLFLFLGIGGTGERKGRSKNLLVLTRWGRGAIDAAKRLGDPAELTSPDQASAGCP